MSRQEFFTHGEWAVGDMILLPEISPTSLYEVIKITDTGVALMFRCGNEEGLWEFSRLKDLRAIPVGKFVRGWFGSRRMVFEERAAVTL